MSYDNGTVYWKMVGKIAMLICINALKHIDCVDCVPEAKGGCKGRGGDHQRDKNFPPGPSVTSCRNWE